jgi:hypothetical protein
MVGGRPGNRFALSKMRWTDEGHRKTHCCRNPTSFSSHPGHFSTRRSPPEKSLYFVFQRGSGSGAGQQRCHAVRHGFPKGPLQTFNEPGRNLIEPQMRLVGVALASAAPFEGWMSTAIRLPAHI